MKILTLITSNKLFSIKKLRHLFLCTVIFLSFFNSWAQSSYQSIDLTGEWNYILDPEDIGIKNKWYTKEFNSKLQLPGSLGTNNIGDEIRVNTPWTGLIVDSAWFFAPVYEKYRKIGNIKVPFWLQPEKYYKGVAWYKREIVVLEDISTNAWEMMLERVHWESTAWIDGKEIGRQNSLSTPHRFKIPFTLSKGKHTITLRVDNRVNDIDVGQNSHSISDHTQSNWNGVIGDMILKPASSFEFANFQVKYNHLEQKVDIGFDLHNNENKSLQLEFLLKLSEESSSINGLKDSSLKISVSPGVNSIVVPLVLKEKIKYWDEFNPTLYNFIIKQKHKKESVLLSKRIGFRQVGTRYAQFVINNRPTILRGTLECAIFPATGYPPTDKQSWIKIMKKVKSYGLNHIRFHSWCPPKLAFEAADEIGVYLQIECGSWANQGASIGDGNPLDKFIYDESERIVAEYGFHPSFLFMAYGNEPAGNNQLEYLNNWVKYWQNKDKSRLYTTGAGWPISNQSDFHSSPDPRIQQWGEELKSIINSKPPSSNFNWNQIIGKWNKPTISHEIGQWCVYPDFKEIKKYTGFLKPKNFEIFKDTLESNGLLHFADSFLLASGKLQTLCYKHDIEAALRTENFGGFQLLDLHDFPGQGTALVGVLNAFWEEKGYVTSNEFSQFCNSVVPLAIFPKMIFHNDEKLHLPLAIANYGKDEFRQTPINWRLIDSKGIEVLSGKIEATNAPIGKVATQGTIFLDFAKITKPEQLELSVSVNNFINSWKIFVYPKINPIDKRDIIVTDTLTADILSRLNSGEKVLYSIRKGKLKADMGGDIKIGFSSIFWNTAWTNKQGPHTLGILCNPQNAIFKDFPTEYHSNWQWWDPIFHSNAIMLDSVKKGIQPHVRVIDDWVSARSLGLLFECKVGKGSLMVSSIDFYTNIAERPSSRQLFHSILSYMQSGKFSPIQEVTAESILKLTD